MNVTKMQAKEFYRDLCGTYNGNTNQTCQGIASTQHIADRDDTTEYMVFEL